jgi:hypothetical protein
MEFQDSAKHQNYMQVATRRIVEDIKKFHLHGTYHILEVELLSYYLACRFQVS